MTALASDLATFYRQRLVPSVAEASVHALRSAVEKLGDDLVATQRESLVDRVRDADQPFMLFVVGVGKAGKSSLVNALVGADVAPKSVVPLTWKIDTYQWSEKPEVALRWDDGRETTHALDEGRRLCAREEERAKEADAEGRLYTGAISEARWRLPEIDLPETVMIVDTPGLHQIRANLRNDPAAERYRPLVETSSDVLGLAQVYLNKADAVLWVLDATQLADIAGAAVGEFAFYERDQHAVINKIDTMGGVSADEICAYARELFGDHFGRYFAVSAKRGRKKPDEWGLTGLRRFIGEEFIGDAVQKKARATHTLVRVELQAAERIARAESARLQDALAALAEAECELSAESKRILAHHQQSAERDIDNAFAAKARAITATFTERLNGAIPHVARSMLGGLIPTTECAGIVDREIMALDDSVSAEARRIYGRMVVRAAGYDFAGRSAKGHMAVRPADVDERRFSPSAESFDASALVSTWRATDASFWGGGWEVTRELFSGTSRWERRAVKLREEHVLFGGTIVKEANKALSDAMNQRVQAWKSAAAKALKKVLGYSRRKAEARAASLSAWSDDLARQSARSLAVWPILERMREGAE